ncbi:hypothetical protein SYK_17570 [Pseudodesulfovibrio nedwellii]|uniref:Cytoplasmic protein n=1 Tax=Pseudodesulfovibrio nedwellii TaxID=2973072 RepID=A0ABM8B0T1_9BACT|nr:MULTISPECIES: cytoplasmic protein [Pseudodesulfovibrio]BDQ37397.1 hypothetical protein SYK_17570 [Pseudodesulfovibrio nedwellii]
MNCLYAFNGELMCFVHVLLNALDMKEKGEDTIIVFEGASVTLIPELEKKENPFSTLYFKAKDAGLIDGACKACSAKLGVLDAVKEAGIELIGDMAGHPSIAEYQKKGYTIITF